MEITAKVRTKSQIDSDMSVSTRPFKCKSVPAINSIIELEFLNQISGKNESRQYKITKRFFINIENKPNEYFPDYKWNLKMVVESIDSEPIYDRLFLDFQFDFKGHNEIKKEYANRYRINLFHKGDNICSLVLGEIPNHENDLIEFDGSYFEFEKSIYKIDGTVQVITTNQTSKEGYFM